MDLRGARGAAGACRIENGRCGGIISVIGIRIFQFSFSLPPCRSATLAFLR